jgi:hypothetical protein
MTPARPLLELYPQFRPPSFQLEAQHRAAQVFDTANINVNGVVPGALGRDLRREMMRSIKFRHPTNSRQNWTWTKLRVKGDLQRRNGGQGTFHASKTEVCEAVWQHYDRAWRDFVLTWDSLNH